MRHTFSNGFPYTCGLPAKPCKLVGGLGAVEARLCRDCQKMCEEAGLLVIVVVPKKAVCSTSQQTKLREESYVK